MSGQEASPPGPDKPVRHTLLAFAADWQRSETFVLYSGGVLLIAGLVTYFDSHRFEPGFIAVGALMMVCGLSFRFLGRRHYVDLTPDALVIHGLLRTRSLPLEAIRQVRMQTLQLVFSAPNRKRLMAKSLTRFKESPVLLLRLEVEPAELIALGRAAGRGSVIEPDLMLLVADAQGLEKGLQPRIRRRPPAPAARRR